MREYEKLSYNTRYFFIISTHSLSIFTVFCFYLLKGSSGFCPTDNLKIYSLSLEEGIFSAGSSETENLELFLLFLCLWSVFIIRSVGQSALFCLSEGVLRYTCEEWLGHVSLRGFRWISSYRCTSGISKNTAKGAR